MFVLSGEESGGRFVKRVSPILPMLLLAACSQDPRAIELADVNLADMDVVQDIRGRLAPEDRSVFGTYVIRHAATSPSFCGEVLVDRDGRMPRTIGEAIDLTVLREERDRRERLAAKRPPTAAEALRRQRDSLILGKEALIGRRTFLDMRHGPAAKELPEWAEIEARMADYDAQLAALEPKLQRASTPKSQTVTAR